MTVSDEKRPEYRKSRSNRAVFLLYCLALFNRDFSQWRTNSALSPISPEKQKPPCLPQMALQSGLIWSE